MNFAPIGNLASDYFQGTQQKRTLALQNAFKDGLPTLQDQNGNPVVDPQTGQPMLDVNAITQKAAKIGGLDAAVPFLSLQMKGQALGGVASAIAGGGAQGAPAAGAPQPQSAAVPAHGIPGGSSPPPGVSATGEGSQPDTLANIVQSQISDPVLAGKVMTAAAARARHRSGSKRSTRTTPPSRLTFAPQRAALRRPVARPDFRRAAPARNGPRDRRRALPQTALDTAMRMRAEEVRPGATGKAALKAELMIAQSRSANLTQRTPS